MDGKTVEKVKGFGTVRTFSAVLHPIPDFGDLAFLSFSSGRLFKRELLTLLFPP